jgi:hypothetical protein
LAQAGLPVLLDGKNKTKKDTASGRALFSIHVRTDCVARRRNGRFACSTS